MIILDLEQGSKAWHDARLGVITASCFDKIVTSKGVKSTQANGYMNKLIAEKLTASEEQIESTEWMKRGIDLESEARLYYEITNKAAVETCGIIYKDNDRRVSCSPDGLIGAKGLEIKCPAPHTHIDYLRSGKLPSKYVQQVQGSLWVTGFETWDFLSYHPTLKSLQITVEKDEDFHRMLDDTIGAFIEKMDQVIKELEG